MPCSATYSCSGGSRSRAPTSATSSVRTLPSSIAMRSGMPHAFPDGDVSGVLRSPCASSQTTASRSCRAASPRIAPTCEQQQPPSTSGRARQAARRSPSTAPRACPARRPAPPGTRARCSPRRPSPRRRCPRHAGRGRARRRTPLRSCGTRSTSSTRRRSACGSRGHRARSALTRGAPRCRGARRPSCRRARRGGRRRSCSRRRRRAAPGSGRAPGTPRTRA